MCKTLQPRDGNTFFQTFLSLSLAYFFNYQRFFSKFSRVAFEIPIQQQKKGESIISSIILFFSHIKFRLVGLYHFNNHSRWIKKLASLRLSREDKKLLSFRLAH